MKKMILLKLFLLQPLWNMCIPPAALIAPFLVVNGTYITYVCYKDCCKKPSQNMPTEETFLVTEQPKPTPPSSQE